MNIINALAWKTVKDDGFPPVDVKVLAGFWYKDQWLREELQDQFMVGVCVMRETDDLRSFPQGKQWITYGPSHNQITHWALFNCPELPHE